MLTRVSSRIGPRALVYLVASLLMAVSALALAFLMIGGLRGAAGSTVGAIFASPTETAPVRPAAAPAPGPVTFDLCAKAGTTTMADGAVVNIWGFALKPAGVACSDPSVVAQLPGPTLVANEGDAVTVNLHNVLGGNSSIIFPMQELLPDTVGVAPGGTKTYTFTADAPGTYLYESGTNSQIQVPMGLYGAFIVRPPLGPNMAYNDLSTFFNVEAILLLSEIDPALNNSADPNSFDLTNYDPRYWLINGKAYPDTANIVAFAGQQVLFRYLNAGLFDHTLQVLGMHQTVIAGDGHPLEVPYQVVSLTVASGQTFDLLGAPPTPGVLLALYSANLYVTNGDDFPGGMLTFIEVP